MRATFRRRLQGSTIKDGGAGLALAAFDSAQEQAQIMDQRFKAACRQPALYLLIDNVAGRQVVRHHAPGRSSAHDPAQPIENFSQFVLSLPGIFGQQGQVRSDEGLFLVADITWVGISRAHATILAWLST
jgi:uncharacterized protein (DUF3084 family)